MVTQLAGAVLDDVDPPTCAEDVELLACTLAMPFDTHDTPADVGRLLARAVAGRGDELAAGLLAAFVLAGITVAEAGPPEAARRLLQRPPGGRAAAVRRPVEEAAKTLRSVLDHMIDHDVPLSSDDAPLLPFVISALAGRGSALPRPPVELVTGEPTDSARDEASALVDAFATELEEQVADQVLLDHAPFLAHLLLSWRLDHGDGDLLRWTAAELREFLLEWYPRKGDADDETLAAVRPSLAAFLRFLAERSLLEGDSIEGLEAGLVRLEDRFAHAARDRRNWGPAKALTAQMRAEGVDPTDPDALEAWMADFNNRPRAERDAVLGGGAPELTIRLPSSGARARHAPAKEGRARRRASRAARKRNRR
ncbi:MAG TPA: hypothetical protein VGJ32_14800 [Solirubrobacteraceae bacterium]